MKILNRNQLASFVELLQGYLFDEFELELGDLEAEMLADFIQDKLGPAVYNRALEDARQHLVNRMELLSESLVELEKQGMD